MQSINDLSWTRIQIHLKCTHSRPGSKEPPAAVFQSVFKNGFTGSQLDKSRKFVFHPCNEESGNKILPQKVYSFYLLFNDPDPRTAQQFTVTLFDYLEHAKSDQSIPYHFALESFSQCETRNTDVLMHELNIDNKCSTLYLEFITPFNLKSAGREAKDWKITGSQFVQCLVKRIKSFFGYESEWQANGLQVNPCYWCYTSKQHKSKSGKGNLMLNGYKGFLPVTCIPPDILALILVCSDIHTGNRTSYGLGYYRIRQGFSYFDRQLTDVRFVKNVIDKMVEKNIGDTSWLEMLLYDDSEKVLEEKIVKRINAEYTHADFKTFTMEKPGGESRYIFEAQPEDKVIEKAACLLLEPVWSRMWEQSTYGYRKDRGREQARQEINRRIKEGYNWVFETDLESLYDTVQWQLILDRVRAVIPGEDTILYRIIAATLQAGFLLDGVSHSREQGLPAGSPLSPLLVNLLLDGFDEALAAKGHILIRYADDFIILARSREEALQAKQDAAAFLQTLHLSLKDDKTKISTAEEGFTFIGYTFADNAETDIAGERILQKSLYIGELGCFTGMEEDVITVRKAAQILARIPFHRVSRIIVLGNSAISTALLMKCSAEKVPVIFCSGKGYHINTLIPDSKSFYLTTGAHIMAYNRLTSEERIYIARGFVQAKLHNFLLFFISRREPSMTGAIADLKSYLGKLESAAAIEEIMGYEGVSGKVIFQLTNACIGIPAFKSSARKHKNPDPLNSLLNFGSYLLFTHCNAIVRSLGLNPYLGFLHSKGDDYESLVCDIMEPFRFRITRLILRLINRKQIRAADFKYDGQTAWLKYDGRNRFIQAFEGEMFTAIKGDRANTKELIYTQALAVLSWVKGGGTVKFYRSSADEEQ